MERGGTDNSFNRGFTGRRQQPDVRERIPPGQHLVRDFPVLSARPTPRIPLDRWSFTLDGLVATPVTWSWDQFTALPAEQIAVDIHCATTPDHYLLDAREMRYLRFARE